MNQIKIWEAKLDYLIVRQTHEHKYGTECREREGSAQIQLCMPTWDELDQNLRGEIGLPGSQTDIRTQIRECMPGAGRVGTNPGLHARSRMGRIKNSRRIGLLQGAM
jgi:hypothetical protein